MSPAPALPRVLDQLEEEYGPLEPPHPRDAFGLLLWENVAYLVDDSRRGAALDALGATVGRQPADILAAPDAELRAVVAGMRPQDRVARVRRVAELALELDLVAHPAAVLGQPLARARRVLRRFPGIGEPGADRILLFGGHHRVLALDSNALRVLLRLGIGEESDNYQHCYRSAQSAAQALLPADFHALVRATLLLRRHGQELCRRSEPECPACPLRPACRHGAGRAMGGNIHPPG